MYYDGIVSKNELKHFIVNICNTLIIQFETMKSMLNENVLKGPQVLVINSDQDDQYEINEKLGSSKKVTVHVA